MRARRRAFLDIKKRFRQRRIVDAANRFRYLKRRMADPDPIAPLAFRAMRDKPCLQRFDELERR